MTGPKLNEGNLIAGERNGTKASAMYLRVSASKARVVLNLIRGLPVKRADEVLQFSDREVSNDIRKVLASAVANAQHNDQTTEPDPWDERLDDHFHRRVRSARLERHEIDVEIAPDTASHIGCRDRLVGYSIEVHPRLERSGNPAIFCEHIQRGADDGALRLLAPPHSLEAHCPTRDCERLTGDERRFTLSAESPRRGHAERNQQRPDVCDISTIATAVAADESHESGRPAFGMRTASRLVRFACSVISARTCWPAVMTSGDLLACALKIAPIALPTPGAVCRLTSVGRPLACANPSAMPTTVASCSPSR